MTRVIVLDNKHQLLEMTDSETLTVPIGAAFTERESVFNIDNDNRGIDSENVNSIAVMFHVAGTMPVGTEFVIEYRMRGYDGVYDTTTSTTTSTYTDEVVNFAIEEDLIVESDFIRITYKFQQGGSSYVISKLLSNVKKKDDLSQNGSVLKIDFDANTILKADVDDTPVALTVNASTFVGRKATGPISAMSVTEAQTLLKPQEMDYATMIATPGLFKGDFVFNTLFEDLFWWDGVLWISAFSQKYTNDAVATLEYGDITIVSSNEDRAVSLSSTEAQEEAPAPVIIGGPDLGPVTVARAGALVQGKVVGAVVKQNLLQTSLTPGVAEVTQNPGGNPGIFGVAQEDNLDPGVKLVWMRIQSAEVY
jgi:hypothetical protein